MVFVLLRFDMLREAIDDPDLDAAGKPPGQGIKSQAILGFTSETLMSNNKLNL